jgi:hypothetical protein
MKDQLGIRLPVSLIATLHDRAKGSGAGLAEIVEMALRYTLPRVTDGQIRTWSDANRGEHRSAPAPLRKDERAALNAIERLKAKGEGSWRFSGSDVAQEAGLRLTDAFLALRALQARGLVVGVDFEARDRWDRPVKSLWCLAADDAAAKVRNAAAVSDSRSRG